MDWSWCHKFSIHSLIGNVRIIFTPDAELDHQWQLVILHAIWVSKYHILLCMCFLQGGINSTYICMCWLASELSWTDAHSVISLVLIQKRILCKAYYDFAKLSLHLLAKMGILLVVDLERTNAEFVFQALEYIPSIMWMTPHCPRSLVPPNTYRTMMVLLLWSNKVLSAKTICLMHSDHLKKTIPHGLCHCDNDYCRWLWLGWTHTASASTWTLPLKPIKIATDLRKVHAKGLRVSTSSTYARRSRSVGPTMSLYGRASWETFTTRWAWTSGILMVTDVERINVEFVCCTLGCMPVQQVHSLVTSLTGGALQRPRCCSDCASCWWPWQDWTCTASRHMLTSLRWYCTPWQRIRDWSPLRSWWNWGRCMPREISWPILTRRSDASVTCSQRTSPSHCWSWHLWSSWSLRLCAWFWRWDWISFFFYHHKWRMAELLFLSK